MKIKKIIIICFALFLISLPTVAFAYSYAFTVSFTYQKSAQSLFWLHPQNGRIYMDVTSSARGGSPTSQLFYVDVIREKGFSGEVVATFPFLRSGSNQKLTAYVTNTSYDKYSLKFRKSNDGQTVDAYGRIYDYFYFQ